MKVLIDIPEKEYNRIKSKTEVNYSEMWIAEGMPLDGLTNGEVMQRLLPNAELHWINEYEYGLRPLDSNWIIWFKGDWWNARYREKL